MTSHGYFSGHKCLLTPEQVTRYDIKCNKARMCLLNLTSVNMNNILARNVYRSFTELSEEKYRQYKRYPFCIHPFSKLRMCIDLSLVLCMFMSQVLTTVNIARVNPFEKDIFSMIILVIDIVCALNIIVYMFTGYVEGMTSKSVVLNCRRIVWKYFRSWFLVDLLASACIIPRLFHCNVFLDVFLTSLKIMQIPREYLYVEKIFKYFRIEIINRIIIKAVSLITTFLIWNIYFQFAVVYMIERSYKPINPQNCSWMSQTGMWQEPLTTRLVYSFDRAVGMLTKVSNLSIKNIDDCSPEFYTVAWLIAKVLTLYLNANGLLAMFCSDSFRAKFYMLSQQIRSYMNQRRFPSRIKNSIIKFYATKYQAHFLIESHMMSCVSGQLREDIIMYTGRQLVNDAGFLKQLPRQLFLQIAVRLKVVIYTAGDVIYKMNTIGDCLYFVDRGTVAIYSESGREICHIEDGDYFGEFALVMKHELRIDTAVAVTNCELFKLDKEDFQNSIACDPMVHGDIRKVAFNRYEMMLVLDEQYKAEIENLSDDDDKLN